MEDVIPNAIQRKMGDGSFKDRDVFTKIWLNPRPVFRFIENSGYQNHFNLILALVGITSALQRKIDKGIEPSNVVSTLVICIIFGGLLGWLSIYIYAVLIRFTGEWIGGKAITYRIFRTLTYANIPFALGILICLIQLYLIKYNLLDKLQSDYQVMLIRYGLIGLKAILWGWTIKLYIIGIAEVQRFSIGKAILNLLLPFLLFIVPLGIIYIIANGFSIP